jgi:hypothetical protein
MKRKLLLIAGVSLLALAATILIAGREGLGKTSWRVRHQIVFTSNGVADVGAGPAAMTVIFHPPPTNAIADRSGVNHDPRP